MTTHRAFERFAQKIVFNGECWEWTGARQQSGHFYGQFRDEHSNQVQAHRFSYEFFVALIPTGFDLDHLCRNEACVNPRHLEPVTHRENVLRGRRCIPCRHGLRARIHCVECSLEDHRTKSREWARLNRQSVKRREAQLP